MAHWDMSDLATVEKRLNAALEDASTNRTERRKSAGLEWEASNTADPNRISFLGLSLELREMIYKEALVCEELTCNWLPDNPEERYINKNNRKAQPNVALFDVCRQISAEAQKVYYGINTFTTRRMFAFELAGRYAMMVPAPYKDLVRQVQYSFDFRHVYCRPNQFRTYIDMVRRWFPSAHVEIKLWDYPSSAHFENFTSREEHSNPGIGLWRELTGWDEIPEGFGVTIEGVGFYHKHLVDALERWRSQGTAYKQGKAHLIG
ncbi:uncharacterized protein BDZ99DRAFT_159418 [Mytilinidion resinicola]|uniref:Uncharacterized protein n=1 Tax=Mytilinidion resinicola TaxID=574789 RepID=A0A6A6Y7A7_9PEZI|nr:uncharacterized protein BDZ99DRAFT_159418 [Mytilinidion resinicola]KAF2804075.1 hypothetical protein BDZ99DRAFT_159418 [Mytilinidion resinicola]